MAIEALESEAEVLRSLAAAGHGDITGLVDSAEAAERDAELLRRLADAHIPPARTPPPAASDRLDDAVRAVSEFLVADAPLGATLRRISQLARDSIGEAEAVGITLLDERERPTTAVFTDDVAPNVDQGQYEDGTGPCLDAFRERRVIRVDDTSAVADRWPSFSQKAIEHGISSTLSLPLLAGDDSFGALNFYASAGNVFTDADEADAMLFATQASVVLANARAYWAAFDLANGLQRAMESRAVIEQAKGKVMATSGCSADEAFQLLVRASQRENVKLREIARRMVEGKPQGKGRVRTPPSPSEQTVSGHPGDLGDSPAAV
jgi:transcriptional regulator with GAF, ATPase, and Fis domain